MYKQKKNINFPVSGSRHNPPMSSSKVSKKCLGSMRSINSWSRDMRLDAMKIMRFHGIEMVISWDLRRSYPVVSSNVASWKFPN